MSLELHRPDGRGGLEPRTPADRDWRSQLRSKRWGEDLSHKRLPRMKNTEMSPTGFGLSVLFWVSLAGLTFAILVVGYGTGFWQ
jgi:hypothetical protein